MTALSGESGTNNSATLVSYGAQEDDMARSGSMERLWIPLIQQSWIRLTSGIANVLWPCADCEVDELGMPLCQNPNAMWTCETTEEGDAEVFVPGDVTVSVGVHHTAPGTLTILGATSDIEILNPDETPFTTAYISGSNPTPVSILIRATSNFSGEVTLVARFLQDNAQLDTQDLLIVKAAEPSVEITDASGTTVLMGDQTTIVGKHISLNTKVTPAGAFVTVHNWTVNGEKVKDYTQSMSEGKITPFNEDPHDDFSHITNPYVDFYWIAGSDDPMTMPAVEKFTVTYTATIDGNNYSDSIEYLVQRPEADLITDKVTTLNPAVGIRLHLTKGIMLRFGHDDEEENLGIQWIAGVSTANLDGSAGEFAFVQLVKADRRYTLLNGDKKKRTTKEEFWLDRNDNPENIPQFAKKDIDEDDFGGTSSNDTPGQTLNGQIRSSADDEFYLYLMYKPDGGIWVTLRKLEKWYWKGTAAKDAMGGWSIVQGTAASTADEETLPTSNDSTELPKWEKRFPADAVEEVDTD